MILLTITDMKCCSREFKEIAEDCKKYGAAKILFSEFLVTTWYSERVTKDIYKKLTENICKANV